MIKNLNYYYKFKDYYRNRLHQFDRRRLHSVSVKAYVSQLMFGKK